MTTALDRCLAEISALGRFQREKGDALAALGDDCRALVLAGAERDVARAVYLAGRIVMYRDMACQTLREARSYKDKTGSVPPAVMANLSYYRRCAANLRAELRAMGVVAAVRHAA